MTDAKITHMTSLSRTQCLLMYGSGDAVLKAATAGSVFSSPRLGRTPTIPPALEPGAGTNIDGGTCEHIPQ